MIVMNRKLLKNVSDISEAKSDIASLVSTVGKKIENNQVKEVRLNISEIENRLKDVQNNPIVIDDQVDGPSGQDDDYSGHKDDHSDPAGDKCSEMIDSNVIYIKNLNATKTKDEYEANALFGVGLGLNVPIEKVERSTSYYGRPAILKAELYNENDKRMVLDVKSRLSRTNEYHDVYLTGWKSLDQLLYEKITDITRNASKYRGNRSQRYSRIKDNRFNNIN